MWSLALALLCLLFCLSLVTRPSSLLFAQLPANTPLYNVNPKWVTDQGSELYNVRAYGAKGDGVTDDTTAIQSVPTLPKGHAKARIVPVRFKPEEFKAIASAAKISKQSLSEWIRGTLNARLSAQ